MVSPNVRQLVSSLLLLLLCCRRIILVPEMNFRLGIKRNYQVRRHSVLWQYRRVYFVSCVQGRDHISGKLAAEGAPNCDSRNAAQFHTLYQCFSVIE